MADNDADKNPAKPACNDPGADDTADDPATDDPGADGPELGPLRVQGVDEPVPPRCQLRPVRGHDVTPSPAWNSTASRVSSMYASSRRAISA